MFNVGDIAAAAAAAIATYNGTKEATTKAAETAAIDTQAKTDNTKKFFIVGCVVVFLLGVAFFSISKK